jgi:hypothetical protein
MEINSSAAADPVSLLKPGDPVRVGERPALFMYARGTAAVVRYTRLARDTSRPPGKVD